MYGESTKGGQREVFWDKGRAGGGGDNKWVGNGRQGQTLALLSYPNLVLGQPRAVPGCSDLHHHLWWPEPRSATGTAVAQLPKGESSPLSWVELLAGLHVPAQVKIAGL